MDETLRVRVTRDDINAGEYEDPERCALALALNRAAGRRDAFVGHVTAGFCGLPGQRYNLSERAMRFVRAFDDYRPVGTSTFVLTKIEEGN